MSYIFDTSKRDAKARKQSILWLLGHLSENKFKFTYMVLALLAVTGLRTAIPYLIGFMIDDAVYPKNNELLLFYAILILGLGLLRIILSYLNIFVTNSIGWNSIRRIREEFFETIQAKPLRFHNRVRSGDLMALATNDMQQLGGMINPGIRMVSEAFIGLAAVIIFATSINPIFTLALTPIFILYVQSILRYNDKMKPIMGTFMSKWSMISRSAQDSITGVRVVRAFNAQRFEMRKFKEVVDDFKRVWYKRQIIQAKYWPLFWINFAIGVSLIASIWAHYAGYMSVGEIISINGMLLILMGPTFIISFAVGMFQSGLAAGERIFHTMYAFDPEESLSEKQSWPDVVRGDIEIKDVSFKYEGTDKYVLKNISLKVNAGETVALVGPTGSGKTTLTKLISRFYPYEGSILLDDADIQQFKLRDLRQNIGRVEQDIFLFASTIRSNIEFGIGDEAIDFDLVKQAAITAQAHDFIVEQPDGYDTKLGERGVGLSGGQKQRIAIARCILINPPILILDDSTSAIDAETEERIALAMDKVMQNRTTFLITHRLSAIRKADKIVVLRDGEIKAVGNHQELVHSSLEYRRIFSKYIELPPIKEVEQ
ncbi:MAG: ABC transporter ATP-binding protein [Candidatus Heimdallarchaeota archaeon]|nr:ABC transporter ATP-binding protein [Candidatus Heimdallarchaeota archaeon]